MTVFGDPTEFAIQVEVEPTLVPPSAVWGRMCVWACGTALGNFEDNYCALFPARIEFGGLLRRLEEFWDEQLLALTKQEAFALLDRAAYGVETTELWRDSGDVAGLGRFNFLANWGEQFDGVKAFLLSPPHGPLRILFQLPNGQVASCHVTKDCFLAAAQEFVEWFDSQEVRLRTQDLSSGNFLEPGS